jgi:hypothetical protein
VKNRSLERVGAANTRPNSAAECSRWSGENPAVSGSNAAPKRNPLRREASAALGASTGENLSAGGGSHTSSETMGTLAVQVAGLKSSLHARYPAGAKVLAKTTIWDAREAAHCTRPIVRLSTANIRGLAPGARDEIASVVVDKCSAAI